MRGQIVLTRSGHIENIYDYSYVIVQDNNIIDSVGDIHQIVSLRSAAKPFLPMPFFESGSIEKFQLESKVISLMVSSHNGEKPHRAVLRKYLYENELTEQNLNCGTHIPYYEFLYNDFFKEKDLSKRQLFHNCSGKHLFLLLMCRLRGYDLKGYFNIDHPIFKEIITELKTNLQFDSGKDFYTGIDGCGVPCFFVSLLSAALSYQKFGYDQKFLLIRNAIIQEPFYIAGTYRIESELIKELNIIVKTGSEGLVCVSIPKHKIGIALKIKSGNDEAAEVAIAALLSKLNCFNDNEKKILLKRMTEKIYTSTKIYTGEYTYVE